MRMEQRPIRKKIKQKNNELKWFRFHPIDWIEPIENKYFVNRKFKDKQIQKVA